jgi:hypothetical protein
MSTASKTFTISVTAPPSGGLVHGQPFTITTSQMGVASFGTKATAKPYLWAPMDGSINPSPLGVVTSWDGIGSGTVYNPTGNKIGGGCAQHEASQGPGITPQWVMGVLSPSGWDWNSYGQRFYVYRKTKRDWAYATGQNVKNIRVWGWSGSSIRGPDIYFSSSNGRVGIEGIPVDYFDYTMSGANLTALQGPINQWYTEEQALKSNSNSATADADMRYTTNGGPELCQFPNTTWLLNALKFKTDTGSTNDGRLTMLYAVHMIAEGSDGWIPPPAGTRLWSDDVYVDNTWARVMIGDNPVFSSARNREIQIPSAWSTNSITITANTASFPVGTPAYLFVIDSTGAASAGFPVSVA